MTTPRLVVIGAPGAGKTTVGRLLADHWDVGFRDTDSDVETEAGESIADLFIAHGEAHFRALERRAVVRALSEHDGVLALGGGAVLDPATQRDLAEHTVLFLHVSLASAAPRVGLSGSRPLLIGSPRKQWVALAEARHPIYRALATLTVDTDGRTPEQIRDDVAAALDARGST